MKAGSMQCLLHHIREAARPPGDKDGTDGQLLESFLAHRDEAAFEALVRRHGPMVLGVCRRVLNNAHDAEDAFQATFLILVRKARSVVPREQVGNWLYGVAYRTALEARRAMARRRTREKQAGPKPLAAEERNDDWQPVLDQELSRLPEKYRLPVVLCLLEGRSRSEVARQLGWPEGTLSSRLAAARRRLAQRLRRRGLGLPGAAGAAALAPHAVRAAVPDLLVAATVSAAGALAAGQAIQSVGLVSARVVALMKGVLQGMWLTRMKLVTLGFLVLALAGLAAGAGAYQTWTAARAAAPEKPLLQPPVPEPGPGVRGARKSTARLPAGPMPFPVLVSLEPQGRMKLTRHATSYRLETKELATGGIAQYYAPVSQAMTAVFPLADVRFYKLQGNSIERLDPMAVAQRLKTEVLALALEHGQPLDPLLHSLIKNGTLLVVLPGAQGSTLVAPPTAPPVPEVTPAPPAASPDPAVGETPAAPAVAPPPPRKLRPEEESAALKKEIDRLSRENHEFRRMLRDSRNDQLSVINSRTFAIPYSLGVDRADRVKLLSLFVSSDRGKRWTLVAQKTPEVGQEGHFMFSAPADGLYWFTVQVTQNDGTLEPADFTKTPPGLQVLVEGKGAER
jgi:RNA polymerase sigma factor (sigma-70 family)